MRIALYHNLPSGGAKRVAYEHCKRLVAAGHEVVVFQPGSANQEFCDLTEVASTVVTLPFSLPTVPARRPARLWALYSEALLGLSCLRLERLQRQIAEAIHEQGFDLLYAHHDLLETAPSLLRMVRIPSVYFCQEPARAIFEAPLVAEGLPAPRGGSSLSLLSRSMVANALREAAVRFRRTNERVNTLAATVVLANSSYSCESILRAHGRVAQTCTLGVDVDFFTPGGERGDYLLSVGAFHPIKGFRFLVRALGCLPADQRPPLVLAGDRAVPGEEQYLQDLALELGVSVTTRLAVGDPELRDLYRGARLFLYAPYLEPLGLTPLEAMACGTPVLGVREGGVRETVLEGQTGRLVERNEASFADALRGMLDDAAGTEQMGQQGPQYIRERWTWEQSMADLMKAFEAAMAPSSCR